MSYIFAEYGFSKVDTRDIFSRFPFLKFVLVKKSRLKKFALSAETPLKKLLFPAIPEWNRIREPAKPATNGQDSKAGK